MIVEMASVSLSEKQSVELCDSIGKMLVAELDSESIKKKVDRMVADFVKKNMIKDDPSDLSKKIMWSVKVALKK